MFRLEYILGACLMFAVLVSSQDFPSDIERCVYSDTVCLSKVVTNILRTQSKGHTGLNIPAYDPLHVDNLGLDKIPGSPVSVEFKFSNIDLIGISQATVLNLTGFTKEPSDLVLVMPVNYPQFVMSGQYSCDGTVLSLPINGQGKMKITFDDVLGTATAKCTTRQENGKTYLNVLDIQLDMQPKKVTFAFENLFNGVKLLGDNMNRLLNSNWQTVFRELKPLFEKPFAQIGLVIVNQTFSKFPYADLFLKVE